MPEIRFEAKKHSIAVLDGYCSATGTCRTEFMNELLDAWAMEKMHEATVVLRVAGGIPTPPAGGGAGHAWIGRSMTLYNDPEVKFGGVMVGGIRISHMSHIERDIALSLTSTKGKKQGYTVHKLEVQRPRQRCPVTLDTVLRAVAKATTTDHINWCQDQIQSLPPDEKQAATEAVQCRMNDLMAEQA